MENDLPVVMERLNLADAVERLICCWHTAHGMMLRRSEATIDLWRFMVDIYLLINVYCILVGAMRSRCRRNKNVGVFVGLLLIC